MSLKFSDDMIFTHFFTFHYTLKFTAANFVLIFRVVKNKVKNISFPHYVHRISMKTTSARKILKIFLGAVQAYSYTPSANVSKSNILSWQQWIDFLSKILILNEQYCLDGNNPFFILACLKRTVIPRSKTLSCRKEDRFFVKFLELELLKFYYND